ncbi:Clr5 domain-containing protein [Colletotrichum acutatum]|uniref:Clr5 domain-containing protein n=1 Tax=Glomerella acutata TaxID=27357 RepID=A0AAD8UXS8_GLOAC|nr:Clr5 domain-containing protein [Colletotrichum acutatum]KAK1728575.1 Clr5 domain-containing protein [Colletotrichum acutatum]
MTKAWKEHKDVIARLYIKENRTLDEVREIMQQDYNFKASTRSYRQHFDQWDLSKYNCKKRTARRQSRDYQQYPEQQQYSPSATAAAAAAVVIVQETYPMSPQSYGSSSGSMSPESEMDSGGGRLDDVDVGQSYGGHQYTYAGQGQSQPVLHQQYTQQQQHHHQQMEQHHRQRQSWDNQVPRSMSSPWDQAALPSPPADLSGDSFFQMSGAEALSVQGNHRPQAYTSVIHPDQYRQQQQQQHYHRQQQSADPRMMPTRLLAPAPQRPGWEEGCPALS